MKILYMLQKISPSSGGGEALFYNFARSMLSKGHDVHIIYHELKTSKEVFLRRPGLDIQDLINDGAKMYTVKPCLEDIGGALLSYKHQMGYIVNGLRKALQIAKKSSVDIIHANTYSPVIPAVVVGRLIRIPVVVTVHHITLDQWKLWSSQNGVHGSTSFIGPLYEKLILKLPVHTVHVVSNTTKTDLTKINSKAKVRMIYNGIDFSEIIKPDVIEYDNYILYIGRLAITKNLEVVILGFREVIQSLPDARLIVIGDGGMRNEWERMAKENGLDQHVVFMGNVSPDTKQKLLNSCMALVLPSILEGFGRVVIEAFAAYKPVLASDIRALAEVVCDGVDGFLISPRDIGMWAEKMKFVLSNKEVSKKMGLNGRMKAKERYDLRSISNEIECLYRNIISDKS